MRQLAFFDAVPVKDVRLGDGTVLLYPGTRVVKRCVARTHKNPGTLLEQSSTGSPAILVRKHKPQVLVRKRRSTLASNNSLERNVILKRPRYPLASHLYR